MKLLSQHVKLDAKVQHLVLALLRLSLVAAAVIAIFIRQWELVLFASMSLALSYTPRFIERNYRLELPVELEMVIVFFVYAALFLGEAENFYDRFWWWDLMLHTISGVVLGFVAFLLLYTLYVQKKLRAKPFVIALFVFSFSLAAGALWEIGEFIVDQLFGLNTQKSGIPDTMGDLIVDAIGAFVVAFLGYLYLKRRDNKGVFGRAVNSFLRANPHLKGKAHDKR